MEKWTFRVLIAAVMIYLLLGQFFLPRETQESESTYRSLNEGWEWLKEDGKRETVDFPGTLDVARGHVAVIRRKLPPMIGENNYLLFYSTRQDVRVIIDGHMRNEYSTRDTRLIGKTSSAYHMLTRLRAEDAGKEIRLEVSSDSNYTGLIREIYIGDRLSLNRIALAEGGPSFAVALLMIVIGIIVVIVCLIFQRAYHRHVPLEDLAWGIITLSAWSVLGSPLRQFVFPNLSTASDATFMLVMLIPYPFLFYINQLQNRRYKTVYMIMEVLVGVDVLACISTVVAGMSDFSDTIFVNLSCCALSIIVIMVTTVLDIFTGKIREYLLPAIGMAGICVTGMIQGYCYLQKYQEAVGQIAVSVGLLFMLVMATISTIRQLIQMSRDKSNAIQSSRSQAQFLASMSHEIRTPINAVLGMDEMILRESNQKEVLEYATDIQSAGKSLLTIINDILDFSKVESGKMELVPVEYSLTEMLRACCNMVSVRAAAKDIRFSVKNNPDLPEKLYGDEVRIRQIIVNFLTNAVKYTEEGAITLIVDGHPAEMTTSKEMWNLKISVRDTGNGVRQEDIPHLFDAFARMDATKNRNVEGTGLGLALCRNLALLMKGKINVESVYGEGSTFIFSVPQKAIGREKIGEFCMEDGVGHIAKPKQNHLYLPGVRILVVDDVAVNLKVFISLLKRSGMTIDTAESGEQCLTRVQEWKYDLIFLDHMMPVMDGMEVMKRIREMEFGPNASTPVIMLTANAILGARESYLEAGFADYLSKPIQYDELEEMITKYVEQE